MRDLAPDILRSRILRVGYYTAPIDQEVIHAFFRHITARLRLRTYEMPIMFAPGGEGRAENEGYDAFVPLIDSGVSRYVWTGPNSCPWSRSRASGLTPRRLVSNPRLLRDDQPRIGVLLAESRAR